MNFAMRSGDEHRSFSTDMYSFTEENVAEKLMFKGRLNKNNQGGLKQRKYVPKCAEFFAKIDNPRCVVKLFKKYLSFVAPGDFYKRPCYMKNMFINAKIDTSQRFITGHSGKRTLCTKLYNEGFDEQMVKSILGHRSDAVRLYQTPDMALRKRASDVLTSK